MSDQAEAWDGTGADPWLPHRLEAVTDAAQAEHDARAAYWAALAGWLGGVAAGLAANDYDPVTVKAHAPAWAAAMDDYTETTLLGISENTVESLAAKGVHRCADYLRARGLGTTVHHERRP